MTTDKGPSISWSEFKTIVPNGTWVRQHVEGNTVTGLPLPIEGILILNVDTINQDTITEHKHLRVTPLDSVDPVVLYAGRVEFKINEEWIDFRELCIRVQERRLDEARATAVDAHPLQWMTHKDELNMSVEQIGAMLYDTATWIESQGNKGYSVNDLMKALPGLRARVLGNAYKLAWENILFYGEGGGGSSRKRNRDFSGWGVHKYKPAHWKRTWMDRFGLQHPQADQLTDEIWDEAHAEHARRSVKRKHERYAGVDLEQEPTRDVAHKAAAMWLMSKWAQHRSWQHWDAREMWMLQARLYSDAYEVFRHEMEYREDQQPQPRRSNKKTQAARDDWATASSYWKTTSGFFGQTREFDVHHFFSEGYVQACYETDTAPDVGVDFDNLPRGIQAETSVGTQNQAEV